MDREAANRAGSCSGVVRWRGWRPPFLDCAPWQRARDLVFLLERDGDLVLVPLSLGGRTATPGRAIDGDDVDPVLETLDELMAAGWQVVGRLHTAFVGFDSEDDFWRETFLRLGRVGHRWPRRDRE